MATRRRRHDQRISQVMSKFNPYMVEFKITTEDQKGWDRLQDFLSLVPGIMQKSYESSTKFFAREIKKIVKRCLQTGKPPRGVRWVKHAESTKRTHGPGAKRNSDGSNVRSRKNHNAIVYQDYTLLNLTGAYERSVDIFTRGGRVLVGIPPRANARASQSNNRLSMNALGIILEYGSGRGGSRQGSTIPARPLWGPAFKQAGGYEKLHKMIYGNMVDALKRRFGELKYVGNARVSKPKIKFGNSK